MTSVTSQLSEFPRTEILY